MNTAKASVLIERAMLRLAEAAKRDRQAANKQLAGQAIAINIADNTLDIRWHDECNLPQITSKKFITNIH